MSELKSFQEVVKEFAEKHGIPFEKMEEILIDWMLLLYQNMRSVAQDELKNF